MPTEYLPRSWLTYKHEGLLTHDVGPCEAVEQTRTESLHAVPIRKSSAAVKADIGPVTSCVVCAQVGSIYNHVGEGAFHPTVGDVMSGCRLCGRVWCGVALRAQPETWRQ